MTHRQRRQAEIYAGIEPIGWDVGVSQPPKAPADVAEQAAAVQLDAFFGKPNPNP